jgi:predicted ester cyclase
MRSGLPDIVFSIQEQVAEHDKVASRFEWTGSHNGEFLGIPATGRPVRVWGVVIDRLEDGRIKDTRIIMDTFGVMAQGYRLSDHEQIDTDDSRVFGADFR